MNDLPSNSNDRTAVSASATDARLPLEVVLEALADDLGDRQIRQAVGQLLPKLEAGKPLDEALAECQKTTPPYLIGLLRSATSGDQLAETCDSLVRIRDTSRYTWQSMRSTLAYPLLLIAAVTGLAILMSWLVIPPFVSLYDEFDLELPPITEWLIEAAPVLPWMGFGMLGLVALLMLGPQFFGFGFALRNATPILGRLFTSLSHQQFALTLASFVRLKTPLDVALRYTADLMDDRGLARATQHAADQVEQGLPLAEAMHRSRAFDRSLSVLTGWGESGTSLDESLLLAADLFESRRTQRLYLLQRIIPPLALVIVASFIVLTAIALFIPLVRLVEGLS